MTEQLVQLVRLRAEGRCEYCRLPDALSLLPFEIDHIIAIKHHGLTRKDNLAYSCCYCNSYKGPNIAGIDPKLGLVTALFHPRKQKWSTHFKWKGGLLLGKTAVGRVTIDVLLINQPERVAQRKASMIAGLF